MEINMENAKVKLKESRIQQGEGRCLTFIKEHYVILGIMILAIATRFIGLGQLPEGSSQDEAYGAYNVWALLTEGIDDRGYAFPVYFVAWGSGMNALYLYLAMPLFKLFGPSILIYRIPQAVIGLLAVWALYVLGRNLFDRKLAYLLGFIMAINPWHIIMCRYGLESNLAPNLFVIGLCFFVLGLKKNSRYLIGAALLWGLTLYAYALTWLQIPLFLVLFILFFYKWIPRKAETLICVLILFLMALPLLIFLCVNWGWIPEIKTPFFSIPKLTRMRTDEFAIGQMKGSIKSLMELVLGQYRASEIGANDIVGAYYYFTTPFFIAGVIYHVAEWIRRKKADLSHVFLLWLFCALFVGVIHNSPTTVHSNMMHIPIIFYGAYGIYKTARLFHTKVLIPSCIVFFLISFVRFETWYFTAENNFFFGERIESAIDTALELAGEEEPVTIFQYTTYKFTNLMWYEMVNVREYRDSVVYVKDDGFAEIASFGRYRYVTTLEEVTDGVYVLPAAYHESFLDLGFEVERVNDFYCVATRSTDGE